MVEHRPFKAGVDGSSPSALIILWQIILETCEMCLKRVRSEETRDKGDA